MIFEVASLGLTESAAFPAHGKINPELPNDIVGK
jgi:hypothetical protein